jgi:hypothetical protein
MNRFHTISHNKQPVLFIDLAGCSSAEIVETMRELPDFLTTQPRNSVLTLIDLTGASIDDDAVHVMQEAAVFDKPFIKRSALVGNKVMEKESSHRMVREFSRREFPVFPSRSAALDWLTADGPD